MISENPGLSASTRHPQVSELFSSYIERELSPGEEEKLEAHLSGCEGCLEEFERFSDALSLVRGAQPLRAPPGFVNRVLKRTRSHRRRELGLQGAAQILAQGFPVEAVVPILLAAAVGLLMVVLSP